MENTPSAPTNCDFMYSGSPTTVYLVWSIPDEDGGAPITQYLLSLTPDNQPTIEHEIQAPITYYNLDTLVHGTNVSATVKASNDGGITYGPEGVFPLIVPLLPPMPPATAEAVLLESNAVSISWTPPETAPEGKAYYFVQSQSSNSSDTSIGLGTADMTQLSCELSGFNLKSQYTFTVQVVGQIGRSEVTTTNIIVFPPPPPPAAEVPVESSTETTMAPAEEPAEQIDTSVFDATPIAAPATTEEPLPEDYTEATETI